MNTSGLNSTEIAELDEFIHEVFQSNVEIYASLASLTAIVYSTVLSVRDEVELMWMKKLSIPSVLYLFARYSTIIFFCTVILENFIPATVPISTCNIFANLGNAVGVTGYFGIQGLLVARAYSLSQSLDPLAKWPIIGLMFLLYLAGIVMPIYTSAAFPGCLQIPAQAATVLQKFNVAVGCLTIITDTIVFAVTLYQVWGTWVLQRDLKHDTSNSIVSVLFKQGLWRYCFVLSVTLVNTILLSGTITTVLSDSFTFLQESLSAIILCEFSLQLRRSNQPKVEELETQHDQTLGLSFQHARVALRRLHANMTAEFGGLETAIYGDSEDSSTDDGMDFDTSGSSGNQADGLDVVGATTTIRISTSEFPWAVPEQHELS